MARGQRRRGASHSSTPIKQEPGAHNTNEINLTDEGAATSIISTVPSSTLPVNQSFYPRDERSNARE